MRQLIIGIPTDKAAGVCSLDEGDPFCPFGQICGSWTLDDMLQHSLKRARHQLTLRFSDWITKARKFTYNR
jgi:hypothetical protein